MAPDTYTEMKNRVEQEIERTVDELRRGQLNEESLRRVTLAKREADYVRLSPI